MASLKRLCLTCFPGESICIGDEVRVEVIRTNGPKVRILVHAPEEIAVDREAIRMQKLAARQPEARDDRHREKALLRRLANAALA